MKSKYVDLSIPKPCRCLNGQCPSDNGRTICKIRKGQTSDRSKCPHTWYYGDCPFYEENVNYKQEELRTLLTKSN